MAFIDDIVMNMAFIKWLFKAVVLVVIIKIAGAILSKYIPPAIVIQLGRIFISAIVLLWYVKIIRIPPISKILAINRGRSTML